MMRVLARPVTARSLTLIACETMLIVLGGARRRVSPTRREALGRRSRSTTACPRRCSSPPSLRAVCTTPTCTTCGMLSDRRELFIRILNALASASLILAAVYYWFPTLIIGRGVFIIAAVLVITLVIGWRIAFEWASRQVRPRERLLLVGTTPGRRRSGARDFQPPARAWRRDRRLHRSRSGARRRPVLNPGVIGAIDDIPTIVRTRGVDRVVVSLADARGKLPMDKLLDLRLDGVQLRSPRLGLRGIHRQDRRREPASELADLQRRVPQDPRADRDQARCSTSLFAASASCWRWPLMMRSSRGGRADLAGPVLYHQRGLGGTGTSSRFTSSDRCARTPKRRPGRCGRPSRATRA